MADIGNWTPVFSWGALNQGLQRILHALQGNIDSRQIADSGIGGTKIATAIDDRNADITYTGTWSDASNNWGFYRGTAKYSNTPGDYFTYTFTSDYIGLLMNRYASAGKINVYIDGVKSADSPVDLYSAPTTYGELVWSTSLQYGLHTIKVEVDSTKNASSAGYFVYLDSIILQRQISLENLEVTRVRANFNISTNVNGYGYVSASTLSGYTFLALTNVNLVTPSPDTGTNKPKLGVDASTVYCWDGPASNTVTVTITAVYMRIR